MSGISFLDVLASSPLLINTLIIRGRSLPLYGARNEIKEKRKGKGED